MAENNNTENSNIAEILQAIINGSSDYPDFNDNPPSRIALLLMLLGNDISNIKEIVENLPNPMIFKGTLGTGGDIETLPAPSEDNVGFTYVVITSGTYAQQAANIGDMFVSNGTTWSYIPSGDIDTWRNVFVNNTEVHGINNKDALKLVDSDSVKVNYDGVNKAVSFEGLKVKSFTYTGTGSPINIITFPYKPTFILSIFGLYDANDNCIQSLPFFYGQPIVTANTIPIDLNSTNGNRTLSLSYNDKVITLEATNTARDLNISGNEYTVYYI